VESADFNGRKKNELPTYEQELATDGADETVKTVQDY
jgi:hypothetical protein